MRQRHGAPAAKRGMDERWLGGSAPDNCLLTASEQYDVVSHRRRFLPLPWPLFGAAFCLWALSGVPPTGVTGEHGGSVAKLGAGHGTRLFYELLSCGEPFRRMGRGGWPAMRSRQQWMASLGAARRIFLSRSKPTRKID